VSEALRKQFNARFTPERYQRFLRHIDEVAGTHVGFRNCETPAFFDEDFLDRLAADGCELIRQLVDNPEYRAVSERSLPERYRVPNEARVPMFTQVDFGVIRDQNGELQPKLVEIQGFPSLYAYQPALAQAYIDAYELEGDLRYMLGGLTPESYAPVLRRAICGDHDPENVILMEIDPYRQKTLCDFLLTEKMLGVRAVCITKLQKHGNRLFYWSGGRLVPVRRIYNRAIVDELERRNAIVPFDWRDDLDVEWAGHPNYYFRISKFSIPFLRHESVPRTLFLDQLDQTPGDLENWVLKPLYSFAGLGVSIGPSREEIEAIPPEKRGDYILQERVNFTPVIETPHGMTKAEVRVMYIWFENEADPLPVTTIIRMGRGRMMGVDHNKNMEWVGASAALYPARQ